MQLPGVFVPPLHGVRCLCRSSLPACSLSEFLRSSDVLDSRENWFIGCLQAARTEQHGFWSHNLLQVMLNFVLNVQLDWGSSSSSSVRSPGNPTARCLAQALLCLLWRDLETTSDEGFAVRTAGSASRDYQRLAHSLCTILPHKSRDSRNLPCAAPQSSISPVSPLPVDLIFLWLYESRSAEVPALPDLAPPVRPTIVVNASKINASRSKTL